MKSTPSASSTRASAKWPIRHLAMTGMVTASMIRFTIAGSAMRATPPSLRMSAGTRSRAITATAPASSAIRACSALVTSMITPPFEHLGQARLQGQRAGLVLVGHSITPHPIPPPVGEGTAVHRLLPPPSPSTLRVGRWRNVYYDRPRVMLPHPIPPPVGEGTAVNRLSPPPSPSTLRAGRWRNVYYDRPRLMLPHPIPPHVGEGTAVNRLSPPPSPSTLRVGRWRNVYEDRPLVTPTLSVAAISSTFWREMACPRTNASSIPHPIPPAHDLSVTPWLRRALGGSPRRRGAAGLPGASGGC